MGRMTSQTRSDRPHTRAWERLTLGREQGEGRDPQFHARVEPTEVRP
jgi:hypothetical protein